MSEEVAATETPSIETQDHNRSTSSLMFQSGEDSSEAPKADWYYADGIPGTGDKPEFFNDKTFKNMAEQAKAHGELRKKLGDGAPEVYHLNVPEAFKDMEISDEDPLLSSFAEKAKDMNLSQDKFDEVVELFLDHNTKMSEQMSKDQEEATEKYRQEQLEAIGPNHKEEIKKMENFLTTNFSEESATQFKDVMTDAKTFTAFQELFSKLSNRKVVAQQTKSESPTSREDIINYMGKRNDSGQLLWDIDRNYKNTGLAIQKEFYKK